MLKYAPIGEAGGQGKEPPAIIGPLMDVHTVAPTTSFGPESLAFAVRMIRASLRCRRGRLQNAFAEGGRHLAPSISAFFPAYNDAWTIASLVVTTNRLLRELTDDYEIIVVNDGSPDHVGEVLEELRRHYDHLKVVTHVRNRGYGGALRSGFEHSSKDLVFYTDGDAQFDPRELTELLGQLSDDVDVVNGYKLRRSDAFYRKVIGKVYHWGVRFAFDLPIRDVDCDFRLFRRHVLNAVQLSGDSGVITVEMVKRIHDAGFRFAEAPVHHYPRAAGNSQFFRLDRVGRTLIDLSSLWWQLRGRALLSRNRTADARTGSSTPRLADEDGSTQADVLTSASVFNASPNGSAPADEMSISRRR